MALFNSKIFKSAIYSGLLYGSFIAVQLPSEVVLGGAAYAPWSQRSSSVQPKLQIKGLFDLRSTDYVSFVERLQATGRSSYHLTSEQFNTEFHSPSATASSQVILIPVSATFAMAGMQAEGVIDISDEELLLLLAAMV